ncbi:unnamed protein product [Trichogramma brassicae]|uniref:Uncharacterized protein n=1 Tax=Trichogramma brassicae TaxID=86971 RepID=A0A6H5J2Y9_9HYME|nr:unnamed protein product [Trichogramma brassicae]
MKIVDQQGCVPGVHGEAPPQEVPTDAESELSQEADDEQQQGQPQDIPDPAALAGDRQDEEEAEQQRDGRDEQRDPVNVVNEEQPLPDEDDVQALWQAVRARIEAARAAHREAAGLLRESFAEFDRFVEQHGRNANDEVPAFARLIATKRAMDAAGRRVLEQRRQQRIAELEEERVRQEVVAFQQATEQRARELQQRLRLAALECRRVRAHSDEALPPAPRPRNCWVCGLPGVLRGRECPNRANHPRRTLKRHQRRNDATTQQE